MPRRHELTEKQWNKIKEHLPLKSKRGRPRADDRKTINGILYVLRTGCQWYYMPEKYGSYQTCHRRLLNWQNKGTWKNIFCHLLGELDDAGKLDLSITHLDASRRSAKKKATQLVKSQGLSLLNHRF
ncbi:MAG: transposase [Candidatus Melainabacteria bacterium]|nr:transposase [Candidatus Melainabacteria bacterium]